MRKELGMFVALVVIALIIGISNSSFYQTSNINVVINRIALLGIFAIGVSFVITTGGIDLSVGSVIGLTGVMIARLSAPYEKDAITVCGAGLPIWEGVSIALLVAIFIGFVQGWLITRLSLQPFIVTLSGMLFIRGVSQTVTSGGTISLGTMPFRNLANKGVELPGGLTILYPVFICAALALLTAYVLHYTVFGRHIFAIGGNRDAARYSGVPVKNVELSTYVISSTLAGVAGVLYASQIGGMSKSVGEGFELQAIAAAVLGGVSLRGGEGTILGALIGSAVLKIMDNGITMFKIPYTDKNGNSARWGLDDNWSNIVIGAVILGAVVLDQVTHIIEDRKKMKAT
jgi:ribose transport system permease protein